MKSVLQDDVKWGFHPDGGSGLFNVLQARVVPASFAGEGCSCHFCKRGGFIPLSQARRVCLVKRSSNDGPPVTHDSSSQPSKMFNW